MLLLVRGVMKARGFKLIELLMVVATIGHLAAAAAVAVTGAAQRSRQSRTLGEMRTVGLALQRYHGDGLPFPPYTGGRIHGFADDIVLVGGGTSGGRKVLRCDAIGERTGPRVTQGVTLPPASPDISWNASCR
jgi:type II secretory pathway pseudopilin PulG